MCISWLITYTFDGVLYVADSTIAQLRAKLATPSKALKNLRQFPTFGPPREPIHFSPSEKGFQTSSSSSSSLRSPAAPTARSSQQLFIPTYPAENGDLVGDGSHSVYTLTQHKSSILQMDMSRNILSIISYI